MAISEEFQEFQSLRAEGSVGAHRPGGRDGGRCFDRRRGLDGAVKNLSFFVFLFYGNRYLNQITAVLCASVSVFVFMFFFLFLYGVTHNIVQSSLCLARSGLDSSFSRVTLNLSSVFRFTVLVPILNLCVCVT